MLQGVVKHMEMNINLIVLTQVTYNTSDPRCTYGELITPYRCGMWMFITCGLQMPIEEVQVCVLFMVLEILFDYNPQS